MSFPDIQKDNWLQVQSNYFAEDLLMAVSERVNLFTQNIWRK